MINNWELVSRIDQSTGMIHYTLFMDGTEQDARLIARKLKGYVKDALPAQAPYVYAFELPSDIDDSTQDKIRLAVQEGIAMSNKVNQFAAGGTLGDPLFNATKTSTHSAFPTFLKLDPSTSMLKKGGLNAPAQRPQLDLSTNAPSAADLPADFPQMHTVVMGENPGNAAVREIKPEETQFSTAAREVFATQPPAPVLDLNLPEHPAQPPKDPTSAIPTIDLDLTARANQPPKEPAPAEPTVPTEKRPSPPLQPKNSTISISDQDMLLKDMEGSVLSKLPLDEILSADTKYDMFVDVSKPSSDAANPNQKSSSKSATAPASDSFNVFDPGTTEAENLLDVAEVHAITEKLTQKNMDLNNKPNMPQQNAQTPAVSSHQTDGLSASRPAAPQAPRAPGQPAEKVPFALGSSEPAQKPLPENVSAKGLPEEEILANTVPPVSTTDDASLPDITIRETDEETLEKTFNLETTFNTELIKRQHDKTMSLREGQPATPAQPQVPSAKTVLHLRKPGLQSAASLQPQPSEKTMLRLRRKGEPAPTPTGAAKPLRSTMSPERVAENLRLAKNKVIDHSIEIPISELKKHNWPLEVPLIPTYTMNNMVMSVNRFAHATAISVIDNPGKLYNPLVLHGGTGTGKTHFLNALAYSFSQKFGQEHIFMTNGVRLSRGIQRYVMEGNLPKFENFMESVKVLLIDDIHLLAINEQNRNFISKLLNSFLKNQKQIIITSKYPPESLEKLEELIKFRLDSGWISELKPATGATHFRIVKKMLIENRVDLNDKQIEEFFGGNHMTLGTVTRSIRRLKVLENLLFQNLEQDAKSQASIFEKLLATKGEDPSSELINKDPNEITGITMSGNGEWGRIGFFYPQNCSNMMNWMVYALEQRAKELGIEGGFDIVVRSSYATENIISSAFKIANLCDNKKLKGAVILGPQPNSCDPSVRENFYDILTHMLEIMLIRCGIINYENVRLPSTYVKVISELMR